PAGDQVECQPGHDQRLLLLHRDHLQGRAWSTGIMGASIERKAKVKDSAWRPNQIGQESEGAAAPERPQPAAPRPRFPATLEARTAGPESRPRGSPGPA